MKKIVRTALLAAIISGLAVMLSGCGSVMEKISGDWTIKSINGRSPADFASANGVYELGTAKNYHFTDKDVTVSAVDETGAVISQTYDLHYDDDVLEILAAGSTISLEYAEAEDQLRYSVKQNDVQFQYILKKGSTDLEGLLVIKTDRGSAAAASESTAAQDENT